jgi:tetratricopeptide (TPR) repeat protein
MDSAIGTAARALSVADPLTALKLVALRSDPAALALRGIAMAQLGDYAVARKLLARAARALERSDPRARARCLAALGEVALARRDLREAGRALDAALRELEAHGDRLNAAFVRLQRVRQLVLTGAIEDAAAMHRALELAKAPPRLRALADLVGADIAIRRLEPREARALLARARRAARAAAIPVLSDEVERAARELDAPVARVVHMGAERLARLDEVEAILRSKALVVDACRRTIRRGDVIVPLVTRPVLLALAVALARAAPGDASRAALAQAAFGGQRVTDSVRARLRVEIGRLRRALDGLAVVEATEQGFALRPSSSAGVTVVLPPADGEASALLALLRGGESWSTSALATATGTSQRTVQRALLGLRDEGQIEGIGGGRSQRWVARPPEGFATTLLLVMRGTTG